MTTPKVTTIKRGDARFYVHPETKAKTPGVTSILRMLPKPGLKYWAAKLVAEEAVNNLGSVVSIAMSDRDGAIDYLKRAPDRDTRSAADIGSDAHDLFEAIARGEDIGRVHPDLEPYVRHFQDFMETCEPEFLFMEETVWSDAGDYAGSFDALATLLGEGAGELQGKTVFLDYKTNRTSVYEEVALQLTGYRFADYILREDGTRVPIPRTDGGAVLHIKPEGWALYPVLTGEVEIDGQQVNLGTYLAALRDVFDWETEVKKHVIGPAVASGGGIKVRRRRVVARPRKTATTKETANG